MTLILSQKNDFLIVCSGANYVYKNNSNNALKNIIKLIKSVKNTNVILICVLHRFDLADHSNKLINLHNSKLFNLQKNFNYVNIIELICNRSLCTKHGLHIKGSFKELLSKLISLCIYSLLGKPSPKPVALEWHTTKSPGNAIFSPKCSQLLVEEALK